MTLALRPYQSEGLANLRRALKVHRRVLFQLPTGGGKTVIAATMLGGAAQQGKRAWFVVHRRELVDQTSRTLEKVGVTHGFIAAGFPPRYREAVTLCSVQTLAARLKRADLTLAPPDLIVWDEAHHCAAGTWQSVAAQFPKALHVGLTATPQRLDGKGLDTMFKALVPGPSISWLIEQGFLCQYRAWTKPAPDVSGVKLRGADFDAAMLAEIMSDPSLMGDAVQHYLDICPGKQAVVFCCSVKHAIATRDAFRARGVIAEELDGTARADVRRNTVNAFRRGEIHVLTSVDLFGEGFDLPELSAAILMRPTKSLGLYMQQVGRALRTAPGKDTAFILDHAGNIARHGLPDTDRSWTLKSRKKRTGRTATPTKLCQNCFGSCPIAATACEHCGNPFELSPRELEHVDGMLREIDLADLRASAVRATSRQEFEGVVARAKSLNELRAIAKAKGYHWKWADHIWAARSTTQEPANAG
jgi:DNA repair protein RadD